MKVLNQSFGFIVRVTLVFLIIFQINVLSAEGHNAGSNNQLLVSKLTNSKTSLPIGDSKLTSSPRPGFAVPIAVPQTISVSRVNNTDIILKGTDAAGNPKVLGFDVIQPAHGNLIGWTRVNNGLRLTYVPDKGFTGSEDNFTFKVVDADNSSEPATVTLKFSGEFSGKKLPVAVSETITVSRAGSTDIILKGTDAAGNAKVLGFDVIQPAHGNLTGWTRVGGGLRLTYVPDGNFTGSEDSFTFKVNDADNSSEPATVTLKFSGEFSGKKLPVAVSETITVSRADSTDIILKGTDAAGNAKVLGYDVIQPAHGNLTGWTRVSNGLRLTYNPDKNFTGSEDSFTFKVTDAKNTSEPATVTLKFDNGTVNTPPVTKSSSISTKTNSPVSIALSASDADGDKLSYVISRSPLRGNLSAVSGNTVTYTPNSGFTGKDNFTFRVTDGKSSSTNATVTITVNADNQAPVATDLSVSTGINASTTVTLNATDPEGSSLSYEIVSTVRNGNLSAISGNKITYSPNSGFSGSDSFTYRAFDGEKYSVAASVTIVVSSNNQPPKATDAFVTTNAGTAFTLGLSGSDSDGDVLTYSIVSSPANGIVSSISGNKVTYTPKSGFTGSDSFTFRVSDGKLFSNNAKVNITVAGQVNIDLTNSKQLSVTGIAGDSQAIVTTTTHAFIANSSGLIIYSKINSNPNKPVKVKTVNTTGFISSLRLSSDKKTIFMTNEVSGLQVVDVSVPENAKIVGGVKTSFFPLDLAISKDEKYAYIADFTHVLVADISNHSNPKIIGSIPQAAGNAQAIAVSSDNKYIFVASGAGGLSVYDVSNPTVPAFVSNVDTQGEAKGITLSLDNKIAYIADGKSGTVIMDISKPNAPFIRSVWNTSPPPAEVIVLNHSSSKIMSDGVTLVIAAGTGGIYSLDVSNPSKPVLTGSKDTPSFTFRFDLSSDETRAIVVDFYFGLIIYDISK